MIKAFKGEQLEFDFGGAAYIRDPHSITEQSGYLTPEQQINRMMAAGVNLQQFRRDQYDYPDGNVPDNAVPDPTQRLGFDLADASEMLKGVEAVRQQQTPTVEGSGEKTAVSPDTVEDKNEKE